MEEEKFKELFEMRKHSTEYIYPHPEIWLKYMNRFDAAYVMVYACMQEISKNTWSKHSILTPITNTGDTFKSLNLDENPVSVDVSGDIVGNDDYSFTYRALISTTSYGKYRPGSYDEPPEYPEIGIDDTEIDDNFITVSLGPKPEDVVDLNKDEYDKDRAKGEVSFEYDLFIELLCYTAECVFGTGDSNKKYKNDPSILPPRLETEIKQAMSHPIGKKRIAVKRFGL